MYSKGDMWKNFYCYLISTYVYLETFNFQKLNYIIFYPYMKLLKFIDFQENADY